MRRVALHMLLIGAVTLGLAGCGAKQEPVAEQTPAPAPAPAAPPPAVVLPAGLDEGPRAAASPVDEAQAKVGEGLFTTKICATCHGFGKKITCPDLKGVTQRRTAKWMESQIRHPDVMSKQDPIARGLLAQYALPMPPQGLTEEQARALIEFLKRQDR